MSQTTPLSALIGEESEEQQPPVQPQQRMPLPPNVDPASQFNKHPAAPAADFKPVAGQLPALGQGQGVSAPEASRREFFGLREMDYKSIILVFAIVLIVSSGAYYSVLRPNIPGTVGSDGRVTIVGSLITAVVGTLLFVLVKFFGKF